MKKTWSIKQIQDLIIDREEWTRKSLYATDSGKCPRGIYYALLGEKPINPIPPEDIRRMEVGNMIERNQIEKLKSLGLFISTQTRIYDEEYNVSGRLDALVISPDKCTPEAKKLIKEKVEIYKRLKECKSNFWKGLDQYLGSEIPEDKFIVGKKVLLEKEHNLHEQERRINEVLLKPNPKNHLMIVEIKSISEWGFKYREKEGNAMPDHINQAMFYLWKLSDRIPNIVARVLYVQVPYQNLLEFDVPFDTGRLAILQNFWSKMNESVKKKELPFLIPDIVKNEFKDTWQVNYQAEWCRYHIKCTGDPNWLEKAKKKVKEQNKEEIIKKGSNKYKNKKTNGNKTNK